MLGAPASGKGTQAARLARHFNLPNLSTGALIRSEQQRGSNLHVRLQSPRRVALGQEGDRFARSGLVLTTLLHLKQLCDHPALTTGSGNFSEKDSGKFQRLAAVAAEVHARGEKMLVFTQFRGMTAPLSEFLAGEFGRTGLVLHGGTSVKRRPNLVEQFQADTGPPFFVLSLKAGGTGLNLTAEVLESQQTRIDKSDREQSPLLEAGGGAETADEDRDPVGRVRHGRRQTHEDQQRQREERASAGDRIDGPRHRSGQGQEHRGQEIFGHGAGSASVGRGRAHPRRDGGPRPAPKRDSLMSSRGFASRIRNTLQPRNP